MQSVKRLSNSFYLWICQISQRAMPYFTTALGLLLVVFKKNLVNLEKSCSFLTPSGPWTEECTERKNVRFISVHAVNLKKFFSASSLMFIAFSAMSRNFFVGLLGRSLHGRTVHLILHRDSKDGYASRTRKDPPARTSPHPHTRS